MTPDSFRHFDPGSRIIYGDDCLTHLAGEMRRLDARHALVICGRTISRAEFGLGTVQEALGDTFAGAFTGVVEQSPLSAVEAAMQALRDAQADAVVAIGGGSAVVTARAATILHCEDGRAEDLATIFSPGQPPRSPRLARPKLPQFIVPTTPTTAYAKSGAAITIPVSGKRLALFDPKARAQALFIHPRFIAATPDRLILDAALDAFAQGVQGLESRRREPLADALLIHGVRLIHRALIGGAAGGDQQPRRDIMLAAQLIGQGTDFTGAGMASALGHSLGARFPVGNGHFKAAVLPHCITFNEPATAGRLDALAIALGLPEDAAAQAVSEACSSFFAHLQIPNRLRDLGVERHELAHVCDDAAQDWFLTQNPRKADESGLMEVLDAAW